MGKKIEPLNEPNEEDKKLEEKVKKMLDPREPDEKEKPKIEVIKDKEEDTDIDAALPTKIEIKEQDQDKPEEEVPDETPVETVKTAPPLSKKISVTHHEEEPEKQEEPSASEESPAGDEAASIEGTNEEAPEPEAENNAADDEATSEEESETETGKQPAATESVETEEADEVPQKQDKELDAAVDDIVASESDKLLEAEDAVKEESEVIKPPKEKGGFKAAFARLLKSKRFRRSALLAILLATIIAGTVPTSRYFILNAAGVRSSASLRVIDQSSLQPLKNVTVTVNGQSAKTDLDGNATVHSIKLGKTELKVEKRAFAPKVRTVTVGWGSNPLGEEGLEPVGTQYSFLVTDFISGKPLEKVEAVNGDASAISDSEGKIKLTLDMPEDEFEVQIFAPEYRQETLTINADDMSQRSVAMAPAKKHVYISKRSGKFDVYAVYADGKEEELILPGTGAERDDITLVSHPAQPVVALVSTRDNERNNDGFLLSTLTIINLNDKENPKQVTKSERVQLVGWEGERLVYVKIASGTSAADSGRHQLRAYNINEDTDAELARSNYFNDVMLAKGVVYFAPSSAYASEPAALYRVNPNGSDKQIVHPAETWSIFRTGHNQLIFTTGRDWFEFDLDTKSSSQLEGEPSNVKSRIYVDNQARETSLWIDQRDGKGVIVKYDINSGSEEVLEQQSGLKLPVAWLSNTAIVYRIISDQESADYVVSTLGGEPKKLADVTDTSGLDRWYYY